MQRPNSPNLVSDLKVRVYSTIHVSYCAKYGHFKANMIALYSVKMTNFKKIGHKKTWYPPNPPHTYSMSTNTSFPDTNNYGVFYNVFLIILNGINDIIR